MKVEGTINVKSHRISIWESEPSKPGAETDGSFEGTISADLRVIEAVWTAESNGAKGDLKIQSKKSRKR